MTATPRPSPPPPSPRTQLRAAVAALADLLLDRGSDRELIREHVRHITVLHRALGDPDALLSLLLRNLQRDLQTGLMERSYYARQLTQAADRL